MSIYMSDEQKSYFKQRIHHAIEWLRTSNTIDQIDTIEEYADKLSKELNGKAEPDLSYLLGRLDGAIMVKRGITPKEE